MDARTARWERERSWREALDLADAELRLLEVELSALQREVERVREVRDNLRRLLPEQLSWLELREQRLTGSSGTVVPLPVSGVRETGDYWSREFWSGSQPTTAQAIVEILRVAARPLRPRDVVRELTRKGWLPDSTDPSRLVSGTLSRLSANRQCPITRITQGYYQFTG